MNLDKTSNLPIYQTYINFRADNNVTKPDSETKSPEHENTTANDVARVPSSVANAYLGVTDKNQCRYVDSDPFADIRENQVEFSNNTYIKGHHGIDGKNIIYRDLIEAIETNNLEKYKNMWSDNFNAMNIEGNICSINKIDERFDELPSLENDVVVYRGATDSPDFNGEPLYKNKHIWFENIANAEPDEIICPDKAYSYTAMYPRLASVYGYGGKNYDDVKSLSMDIKIPKGAKVSRCPEGHGAEILMPRNAQYKVIDKKVDSKGNVKLYLEYIIPTEPLKPLSLDNCSEG